MQKSGLPVVRDVEIFPSNDIWLTLSIRELLGRHRRLQHSDSRDGAHTSGNSDTRACEFPSYRMAGKMFLSRWVKIGNDPLAMDASMTYMQRSPEIDDALCDKRAVRGEQSKVEKGAKEIPTVFGSAKHCNEESSRNLDAG